jgi:hypothetical protein
LEVDVGEAPKRIQRKRTKGWRMPEGAVNVTRPTIWGNPFVCDDPSKAVEAYRRHCKGGTQLFDMGGPGGLRFAKNMHPNALHWAWPDWLRTHLHRLRGKDLVCWCPLDAPCHADVLLEIANGPLTCDATEPTP